MKKTVLFLIFVVVVNVAYAGVFDSIRSFFNPIAPADKEQPVRNDPLRVAAKSQRWQVLEYSGVESTLFNIQVSELENKRAEVCLIEKNMLTTNPSRIKLTSRDGSLITNVNKETRDGTDVYCFTPTTQDYLKFGDDTIVIEYQNTSMVNYNSTWFDLNVTLYIDLGHWNNTINNVYVFNNPQKKFGANVTGYTTTQHFRYVLDSTTPIQRTGYQKYSLLKKITTKCGAFTCDKTEEHRIDFTDICNIHTNTTYVDINDPPLPILFDPQCTFNLQQKQLQIDFYAPYNTTTKQINIDPTITLLNVSNAQYTSYNLTNQSAYTHLSVANNLDFINETNLVFYMPFDTNTTVVYDYTKQNIDGQGVGLSNWTPQGKIGGANHFGTGAEAIALSAVSQTSKLHYLTTTLWFKIDTGTLPFGAYTGLVGIGNTNDRIPWIFGSSGTRLIQFQLGTTAIQNDCNILPTSNLQENIWYHAAFVFNLTDCQLYLNGLLNNTDTTTSNITDTATSTYFIGEIAGYTQFQGLIDEVMLINTSLSPTEVYKLYNHSVKRFYPTGQQIFTNIDAGTGNIINLSTTLTQNFDSNINFSFGNLSGDTYVYTQTQDINSDTVYTFHTNSPHNFSLKFDYYAGNTSVNSFISPTLQHLDLYNFVESLTTPNINYVNPTPANQSTQSTNSIVVNVSVTDDNIMYGFTDFNDSLLAWWRLDNDSTVGENDSHVYDWSGNGFNGTVVGNASFNTSARFGGGHNNHNINGRIEFGNGVLSNLSALTISSWAFIDQEITADYISDRAFGGDTMELAYQAGGFDRMSFQLFNHTGGTKSVNTGAGTIFEKVWHHYVATYNGTQMAIFLDGKFINAVNFTGRLGESIGLFVGDGDSSNAFNGLIDEVIIFNRSLTANEITSLYRLDASHFQNNYTNLDLGNHTFTSYVVDAAGNMNTTGTRTVTITTPAADTCTYSSGTWEVTCSDNCIIITNTDLGSNTLSLTGTGTFTNQANISLATRIKPSTCQVIMDGGRFVYE